MLFPGVDDRVIPGDTNMYSDDPFTNNLDILYDEFGEIV